MEIKICPECRELLLLGYGYQVFQTNKGWTIRRAPANVDAYHQLCARKIAKRRNQGEPGQRVFRWA